MPLTTEPLGSQSYQQLLSEILAGKRPAGQRISEESIAAEFGISRTPAREALMLLAADGLVERVARKGCRVRAVDRAYRQELVRCRALLESLALDLAFDHLDGTTLNTVADALREAGRADDAAASLEADTRLHELIVEACPNRPLVEIIRRLQQQSQVHRQLRAASTSVDTITRERLAIVDAIATGDRALARRLLEAHILQGSPE